MHFNIVSLFPEFFSSPLSIGLLGKALKSGLISCAFYNPRDYADNKYRTVDDAPYGGGPGMIIQAEPVARALEAIDQPGRMLLTSPAGEVFTGKLAAKLACDAALTFICGRYEGIDARLALEFPLHEVCVGEAIINGGETAALAMMEAIARFVPGFLGDPASTTQESFTNGLLEYPQYTRPEIWRSHPAPPVLTSGNHGQIAQWRHEESIRKTARVRPDLLEKADLAYADIESLASMKRLAAGRNLGFCLLHYPVRLDAKNTGASSLTNLDIHDIARISHTYGMGPFYVVTPLREQLQLLHKILKHWLTGADCDRADALRLARPASTFANAVELATGYYGMRPVIIGATAALPKHKHAPPLLGAKSLLEICARQPVLILLGTAKGLDQAFLRDTCDALLKPVRFLNANHLSVRSAAAIIADRILGDFN